MLQFKSRSQWRGIWKGQRMKHHYSLILHVFTYLTSQVALFFFLHFTHFFIFIFYLNQQWHRGRAAATRNAPFGHFFYNNNNHCSSIIFILKQAKQHHNMSTFEREHLHLRRGPGGVSPSEISPSLDQFYLDTPKSFLTATFVERLKRGNSIIQRTVVNQNIW